MNRRGCVAGLLVLALGAATIYLGAGCLVSLLPASVATQIGLPTDWPVLTTSLPFLSTAVPAFQATTTAAEVVIVQGEVYSTPTLPPAPTPTAAPKSNGKLVYLGFDQVLYSLDVEQGGSVRLGQGAGWHIFPRTPWHSPNGKYVLVVQPEEDDQAVFAAALDGSMPPLRLGAAPVFPGGQITPQFFQFSPNSAQIFFTENTEANVLLTLMDLPGGQRWSMSLPIFPGAVNSAQFLGSSGQLLAFNQDADSGEPYLGLYQTSSDTLVEAARLVSLVGWQPVQISASPDGGWIALVLQDSAGSQKLFGVELAVQRTFEIAGFSAGESARFLLLDPAWSPDSRYVLFNRWITAPERSFGMLAYDVRLSQAAPLVDGLPSRVDGQPVGTVRQFSPDWQAAVLAIYEADLDTTHFWLAVLDGSSVRQMGQAVVRNNLAEGEFITALLPDWTGMIYVTAPGGTQVGSLYAAQLDGSLPRLLDEPLPIPYFNLGPVLSPDGRWLAYLRADVNTDLAELAVIGIAGQDRRTLDLGGAPAGLPLAWLEAPALTP
jgi:Tol biopolymer transport system component